MACSTALGSHLGSSSPRSGPPQVHLPKQATEQVIPIKKTSISSRSSRKTLEASSFNTPQSSTEVAEQKKQTPKPHAKLGWRFLLKGQTQAAMSAYRQALRNNPKSARAYLGLGITMKSIGQINLAKKAFLKAVNLNPQLPSALVHLGYLYADGQMGQSDFASARRLFRQASQLGDPFASIALLDIQSRSNL